MHVGSNFICELNCDKHDVGHKELKALEQKITGMLLSTKGKTCKTLITTMPMVAIDAYFSAENVRSELKWIIDVATNATNLDKVNAIRVRNFEYRLPDEITELDKGNAINISGVQLGPIAQELQQVFELLQVFPVKVRFECLVDIVSLLP